MANGDFDVVKDMYEGAATTIRSPVEETSEFQITIELQSGSTLRP